jgi:hypothetical protein
MDEIGGGNWIKREKREKGEKAILAKGANH